MRLPMIEQTPPPFAKRALPRPGRRPEPVPTTRHWQSVTINPYLYAALGLLMILGTVQVAKAMGQWATTGRVTGSGERVVITGADPYELRGWMTVQEVSAAYGVPVSEFYSQFGIPPETPASRQLKELETVAPGFAIENVRTWLARRQASVPGGP